MKHKISYESQFHKSKTVFILAVRWKSQKGDNRYSDFWPCRLLKHMEYFELDLSCLGKLLTVNKVPWKTQFFFYCTWVIFSSVQSLSRVQLFVTPWTIVHQASLSITNSRSLLKLMSIELVMSSNHIILCRPFLLSPLIFPSIRVFSNESVLRIKWPKYWSFRFSISPSKEYSGLISFRMG